MTKLIYAPMALADIDNIWDYTIEKWGIEKAKSYTLDIERSCNHAASGEKRIKRFEDIPEISGFIRCNHHYIFIVQNDTSTNIIGVLHEKMDFFQHLARRLEQPDYR